MDSYGKLTGQNSDKNIDEIEKTFLDKIYLSLENATYEELIDITHEDSKWQILSKNAYNAPVMNLEKIFLNIRKDIKV